MKTTNDVLRWIKTLPGGPRVKLIEYQTTDFGRLVICFHRNHRRRFKRDFFRRVMPIGLRIELRFVPHAALKNYFEVEYK